MTGRNIHLIMLTVFVLLSVRGEKLQDVQRVLDNHFAPAKYNKLIRGVFDQQKIVEINLIFNMLSLSGINEAEETIDMMGVLHVRWTDERLVWDPADYNDTQSVHAFQNEVWKPEIVLANPANVVSVLGNDRIMTTHYHNGTVNWSVGDLFKSYCTLDVTAYPWDRQTCPLRFMVWGYYSNEVQLMTPPDGIDLSYYSDNGAWELLSTSSTSQGSIVPTVQFTLTIRRFSKFAVVNVLVPVLTLTVLNLFAFFIPPASGEKLSYCITMLLALSVFLSIVTDLLPRNSNNMALLCYYLMFVLTLSTFICVSSVLSVGFYHMAEIGIPPRWIRQILSTFKCRKSLKDSQDAILSLKETSKHGFKESKQYEEGSTSMSDDNLDNITWQDLSKFVNSLSCIITLSLLFVSSIVFVIFILAQ